MALVLQNAVLVDLDPPRVETGGLRIAGGQIVARAPCGLRRTMKWSIAAARWCCRAW